MKRNILILGALIIAVSTSCHRSGAQRVQTFSPAVAALIQKSTCIFVGNLVWINPISQPQQEPGDIAHFRVTEVLKGVQTTNKEIEVLFHLNTIHENGWDTSFERGQSSKADGIRYVVFLQRERLGGRSYYRLTDLYLGVLVFDDWLREYVNGMEKSP